MFGIVDGTNKRGRPCRESMDDIVSWCKTGLQELNSLAPNRRRWKLITRQGMETNGRWSHGSWKRKKSSLLLTIFYLYLVIGGNTIEKRLKLQWTECSRVLSIAISVYVGLSVCLSVRNHIAGTTYCPNFTEFSSHVAYGDGLVLLWQRYNTSYTSGFVDDVTLSSLRPEAAVLYSSLWPTDSITNLRRRKMFAAVDNLCIAHPACLPNWLYIDNIYFIMKYDSNNKKHYKVQ